MRRLIVKNRSTGLVISVSALFSLGAPNFSLAGSLQVYVESPGVQSSQAPGPGVTITTEDFDGISTGLYTSLATAVRQVTKPGPFWIAGDQRTTPKTADEGRRTGPFRSHGVARPVRLPRYLVFIQDDEPWNDGTIGFRTSGGALDRMAGAEGSVGSHALLHFTVAETA
jgi:hypothetical protein